MRVAPSLLVLVNGNTELAVPGNLVKIILRHGLASSAGLPIAWPLTTDREA